MASHSDLALKALNAVLEDIRKYDREEYQELNKTNQEKIIQAARATATETQRLTNEFCSNQPKDIAARLSKHLSHERIQLIRGGLEIPTFRLEIAKREDGKHWSEFTRDGKQFLPSQAISTADHVNLGSDYQNASILVEAILLIMSVVGNSASPRVSKMQQVIKEAVKMIQASLKLQKALKAFVTAWDSAGSSYGKAQALYYLIMEIYSTKIMWTIIKFLQSDMTFIDWLETAVKVTVMILAALATDGAVLIAEFALTVLNAVDFAKKIANIKQLSEIKITL